MEKSLNDILPAFKNYQISKASNAKVTGISDDSRKVKNGNIFVALKGENFDGHDFISQAEENGAVAVVGQRDAREVKINKNTVYIKVSDSRTALGELASFWYGKPSKKLKVIGVTGTDGKTTTANFIYQILVSSGKKAGLISTVSAKIGKEEIDTGFHVTNPEPILLHKLLSKMVSKGCEYAVLEVTSHGIAQERIAGIDFDLGVLTNITHEHLDYHKTFEDYMNTKLSFLKKAKYAVLNKDDENFDDYVGEFKKDRVLTYSITKEADLYAKNIKEEKSGLNFELVFKGEATKINSKIQASYNLSNTLAALLSVLCCEQDKEKVFGIFTSFELPKGRMEKVYSKEFDVYIDFAHTPNALKNALKFLKGKTSGRLFAVFGSAGERDPKKRFLMGEISAKLADISVLTAEDPRSENVMDIIGKIAEGFKRASVKEFFPTGKKEILNKVFVRVPERKEAIFFAIDQAEKGDIVAVFGKAHEKSMAYGEIEHPWSDHEAVKEALTQDKALAAVVLAAGKGTRMNSDSPKVLHKIAGRAMVDYSLSNLRSAGFGQVVVVVGFKKDEVVNETQGAVKFAVQDPPMGTGHAARVGLEKIDKGASDFLVINGDDSAFYSEKTILHLIEEHKKQNAVFTFATVMSDQIGKLGEVVRDKKGNVKEIKYWDGLGDVPEKGEINCGAYVFDRIWFVKNIVNVKKNKKGEYYITDLIDIAIKDKDKLLALEIPEDEWVGVNTKEELKIANEKMRRKIDSRTENKTFNNIHFMGIGGSGISAASLLAKESGFVVTGCDLEEETAYMDEVKSAGVEVFKGHDKDHIKDADLLVTVPSVFFREKKDEELVEGEKRGIVMTWQEFLGKYLQKDKKVVAISGTHGKSTSTALTSLIFEKAKKDPSAIVGAIVSRWKKNYRSGKGEMFVTEADEFYNNFLNYEPDTIMITNIEYDHPDFFRNPQQVFKSFKRFVKNIKGSKNLVVNQDSIGVKKLLDMLGKDYLKNINVFGYTLGNPLFEAENTIKGKIISTDEKGSKFEASSEKWGDMKFELNLTGKHNVSNALGVIAISRIYGIENQIINDVFKSFEGVGRRLELIGTKNGISVYDDYAHHPTEIKATLSALRQKHVKSRIWAVVEAHSYSRTKALLKEYKGVFDEADKIVIGPIFKARDTHDFGIGEHSIVKASEVKNAEVIDEANKLAAYVSKEAKKGDVILVMGAGKSYQWARNIYNLILI